ncbi:hypothetical protein PFISCL1PPCAC_12966 [Pristionchus fissidentatus]|uniref:Cytochrome P450 n=1 Tax=Pristionchus fissidentatus TaxID=1538716 RepID=A0AAV5VV80_9BILA|nr:hypothetical protein PFISCL1PPCAC_12966 [Pristionchus fissidentatus]
MVLLLCSIIIIVYVVFYYINVRKYPPGPLPLPIIGNLYHLNPDSVHEYVHKIGKDYGHCLTLFLPKPIVFFTHYDTIKEALVTQGEKFAGRSHLPPETLFQKTENTGLLISDGDVWREQRRTSLRIMRDMGMGNNLMEAQINRCVDEMLYQLNETNDGVSPFDMNMPIQLCIGNVINETLFGYHFKYSDTAKFDYFKDCLAKHLQNMKDNFYLYIVQAWPWTKHLPIIGDKGYKEPQANVVQYHQFIEDEVDAIAKMHDADHEPTNFVESYLQEMKKNPELTMEQLYAIAVDFWMAGMETTSTTIRWGVLYLMKNPDKQEKIRAELLSVVGRDRRLAMSDKPRLPYFVAAIAEIQRVANMLPFLFFHRCTEATVIGGHPIPKDTLTYPYVYSVLKDDEVFEEPDQFMPERFLEADEKTFNKKTLERMVAFGLGKRQCVGESLARIEMFLVLGTLLLNFRLEPTEPIDLEPVFGQVLNPKPFKCRVAPL